MSLAAFRSAENLLDPVIQWSETESRRFGLPIGRIEVPETARYDANEIVEAAVASGLSVIIVRYSARNADWFAGLSAGRLLALHADTLVYFEKPICPSVSDDDRVSLRKVSSEEEITRLEILATAAFEEYRSHYFANPLLDRESIARGYAEWATSFCSPALNDRVAWLATLSSSKDDVGMAAVSLDPDPEFALVAVSSAYSGSGLYGGILAAAERQLAKMGEERCSISTQVHNLPVIRSVSRRDYRPVMSLQTVHLVDRALLNH